MKRIILLLLPGLLFPLLTYTQVIGYTAPDDFTVCQNGVFEFSIQNTTAAALENVRLLLTLPCAVEYVASSVSGATESNISDLENPEFDLPDIAVGVTAQVTLVLHAPCDALTCIDAGTLFTNFIQLTYTGGSTDLTTDPYLVETPLLVIRKVESPVLTGTQGQTLIRKVYIRNTRLGAVEEFTYTDLHDAELQISANQGTDVSPNDQTFSLELTASDFAGIGDGDGLFEFNEEIVIEEEVFIAACAFNQTSLFSEMMVNWGCDGSTCANPLPSQLAVVKIQLNPNIGDILDFAFTVGEPVCYCSDELIPQSLTVFNTDPFSSVSDGLITITQTALGGNILAGSIRLAINGDTIDITPEFSTPQTQDCVAGLEAFRQMQVTLPTIPALGSATILWNTIFCQPAECQASNNFWNYDYSYVKDCAQPGDVFFQEQNLVASNDLDPTLLMYYAGPIVLLEDGDITSMQYVLQSRLYDEDAGTVEVEFLLPCGLVPQTNDWLLGMQAPLTVNIEPAGTDTRVTLEYALPLDSEQDTINFDMQFLCAEVCNLAECEDSLVTSCIDVCMSPTYSIVIESSTNLNIDNACPTGCRPESCSRLGFPFDCDIKPCLDTVPGYAEILELSFLRTNFGLPDTNDDFLPDPGDPFDLDNIRLDRALTGDTLRLSIASVVVIDEPGTTFANGTIDFQMSAACSSPNFPACNSDALLAPNSGLENFSTLLEIYDNSSDQWYLCDQITGIYAYDISVSNLSTCGIPSDYEYDHGDSIRITCQYKINYNLAYVNTVNYVNPRTALIRVEPAVILFNETSPELTTLSCTCPSAGVDVTGYGINNPANIASFIPQCASETTFGYPDDFSVNLRFGNFFPYEFRPIAQLVRWQHEVHPAFDLVNIHVENLSNNFTTIIQDAIVPFTINNGFYEADFSSLIPDLLDETFTVKLTLEYQTKPCGLEEASIDIPRTYFYEPLPEYGEIMEAYPNTKRYTQRQPNLHLNADLCDATFFNNQVLWDFTFDNTPTSTSLESDLIAYNCWIRPVSNSNLVSDFVLTNSMTGQVYPEINGIFQLDSLLNRDSLRLQLTGINQSCLEETLLFEYGWSCEPYVDPIDQPCDVLELTCNFQSPPGVIDMQPDPNPISALLCDTMPWLEIEVFDASLGAVYQLGLEVQLPPGMTIPNGASQMAYPAQTNNFVFINDPIDLGNGLYRWVLTDALDTLANYGLPGVNFVPDNALKLRYKTLTDCDFISGAFPIYKAGGQQVCGDPSNSVAKIGEPMSIIGVSPPDATSINVSSSGNPGCSDSLAVTVNVNSTALFSTTDSLLMQLPPGVTYVNGSCISSLPDCTPQVDGNILSWPLPAGQNSMDLSFQLIGFSSSGCQALSIPFYTTSTANANCTSSGSDCSIKVLSGSRILSVNVDQPIYALSNFTAMPLAGGGNLVDLNFDLGNSGPANVDPIFASLFVDTNGNGQVDGGDTFLGTYSFTDIISTGTTIGLSIPQVNISPEDICRLMLVVNDIENCSCNTSVALVQGPFVFPAISADTICSGDLITIGVTAQIGHNYQWETANGLSCLDCSSADFSIINTGFDPVTYQLILNDDDTGNCLLQYEFLVTVQPDPSIISADEIICQGATATLLASPGASYQWAGAGITDPNVQVQMVSPMNTGEYSVTITDEFGCIGIDTVLVTVLESPIADAGEDISTCMGPTIQLDAVTQAGNSYLWTPGAPFLDDPSAPNPTVLIPENQIYILTVFNSNCTATDTVEVTYFDGLDLSVTGDLSVCQGDTAFITLSGADNYDWSPSFIDMCQNPECSVVAIILTDTTPFTITATTLDGCMDTIEVTVAVVTDAIVTTQNLEICSGSSVEIFGIEQSEAGTYCDTLQSGAGCLEISCVELSLSEGVTIDTEATICQGDSIGFQGEMYSNAGTYCITTSDGFGCDSTNCLELAVWDAPLVGLESSETVVQSGETVDLLGTGTFESFTWLTPVGLSCTDCLDPTATVLETTTYTLRVTDVNGCEAEVSIQVRVENICDAQTLLIPDAFTANNNGKNDRFRVINLNPYLRSIIIEVYNRWGEQVYREEGNEGWDGTFRNEEAPEAVYLYLIRAQCTGEEEKLYKGNVTLLR